MSNLPFVAESLVLLGSMRLVVSPFMPDNRAAFIGNYVHKGRTIIEEYTVSIWDLETGIIAGTCDPSYANELHVSQAVYRKILEMLLA